MWELPEIKGEEKIPHIASRHKALFEQFRETGRRVKITVLPGNHDYELACLPCCKDQLAQYNIRLEPVTHILREVAGRKIWIEHGNQRDAFNTFPDFGNRYGLPEGYYITLRSVVTAAEGAERGKSAWLNDLASVYPTEDIPFWIWSNYFYKEMGPILRLFLLPFLLLFTFSVIVFAGRALENARILPTTIFHMQLGKRLGLTGQLVDWVLWVNGVVISFLLILAIPAWLLVRDVRATLLRFGVDTSEATRAQKEDAYSAAAKAIFDQDPSVAVFIYGHTHTPFLRKVGERCIINTGTWIKRLYRTPSRLRLVPDVYAPSYRLNCFTISEKDGNVRIGYEVIHKAPPRDLTILERLMILGRHGPEGSSIPAETLIKEKGSRGE
jgi:UDP-2,3-diacylglucosamine pyrophosphatase LpxH